MNYLIVLYLLFGLKNSVFGESSCISYQQKFKKLDAYQIHIENLLVKNKDAKKDSSSPSRKLKITSNLIILSNKKQVMKNKKQFLIRTYPSCFKGSEYESKKN